MKNKKHRLLHLFIAAVAIVNLVFLFFFQYGLSNKTPAVQAAERASKERAEYDIATGFSSEVGVESGAVIVTSGLSADDEDADLSEEEMALAEAESEGVYEIESTAETSEISAEAEEETIDESEEDSGKDPTITLSSDLPSVDISELSKLAKIFTDLGALSADDGFGNDISDQITATYEKSTADSMEYHVTFSVTTRAGKTASEECDITIDKSSKPILELKSDKATLSINDEYHYLDYVKTAMDIDGSSLIDAIDLDGYIALGYYGTYEMTYYVISAVNGERVEKTLTVTIE